MSKEKELTFIQKVSKIQTDLKAPKNLTNKFAGYQYRNQEGILEAVKPLLAEHGLVLTLEDTIEDHGYSQKEDTDKKIKKDGLEDNKRNEHRESKNYVKATATLTDGEKSISVSAYARESDSKKGMDHSQLTGATSSYARKYALNGLFLIDDTKDSDETNTHGKKEPAKTDSNNSLRRKKTDTKETKEEPVKEETETKTEEKPSSRRRRRS